MIVTLQISKQTRCFWIPDYCMHPACTSKRLPPRFSSTQEAIVPCESGHIYTDIQVYRQSRRRFNFIHHGRGDTYTMHNYFKEKKTLNL